MSNATLQPSPRIPLSLVTGFLGSGKTTFLRHLSCRLRDRRIVYLLNEFSALDVDGQILRQIGPDTISIPGGSIFCKCLVVDFLHHLQEIPRRFAQKGSGVSSGIDGVVVEASGIANPKVVADMLLQTKLDAVYDLASIVTTIDPGSVRKLLVTLPNIRAQLEAADIVLLNKIDRYAEPDIAAAEATVRGINPAARLIRTTHCAADIELFGPGPTREGLHGDYAECADPHYGRFSVTLNHPIDLPSLQAALADLADDLYRVKGFVPTPSGMIYLDSSTTGLSLERVSQSVAQPGLAMIARADRAERIEAFIADIQAGRHRAAKQA